MATLCVMENRLAPLPSTARAFALGAAVFAAASALSTEASAENLIKQPGNHNQYSFELEPQLAFYHWGGRGWAGPGGGWGGGFGPGIRVSIPFMHNGPIDTINNNIGISFGANTIFWNGGGFALHTPVAFQWNFYFTEIISVLGEVGLATNFVGWNNTLWVDIDPVFQGGGRFQFGKVGVLVRIGWPTLSVGCNIQF